MLLETQCEWITIATRLNSACRLYASGSCNPARSNQRLVVMETSANIRSGVVGEATNLDTYRELGATTVSPTKSK